MNRRLYIIVAVIIFFLGFNVYSKQRDGHNARQEPAIAVMYAHPELAEEFARTTVKEFAPDPESLKILIVKPNIFHSTGHMLLITISTLTMLTVTCSPIRYKCKFRYYLTVMVV